MRAVLMLILIVPLIRTLGLEGAALARLCVSVAWFGFNVSYLRRVAGLPVQRYLAAFLPGLAISAVLAVVCAALGLH